MESSALRIVRRLRAAGHEALYAGGCVRDALMGKRPHDFDIATSARTEQVQSLFPRTVLVGAQFGVILVIEDGSEYQVATFRSDGIYKDGRHPQSVTFGSAQGDAQRGDFTVNGLFYDPIVTLVFDFVGGRKDLETRTLRAIGIHPRALRRTSFGYYATLRVRPGFRNRRRDLEGRSRRRVRHPRGQRRKDS